MIDPVARLFRWVNAGRGLLSDLLSAVYILIFCQLHHWSCNNIILLKLNSQTKLYPHTWQKFALFDKNKPYTRNLISTDHKTYTLLLLCWNPEVESPIHNHPCDGCWLQVLQGNIQEVRYDTQLNPVLQMNCNEGSLSYITDNYGYHKVGNPSQTPAVTLHLYSPPFETCQCWRDETSNPSEPAEGKNTNHSEYGFLKKVWWVAPSCTSIMTVFNFKTLFVTIYIFRQFVTWRGSQLFISHCFYVSRHWEPNSFEPTKLYEFA